MSVERDIIDELDGVLACVRRAEQSIIGKDSSDKLEVVKKLVNLEESIKSIKNDISIPILEITEDTYIDDLQREKILSVRAGNCLRRDGCKTVGDISKYTAQDISIIRNMGRRGTEEVIEFMKAHGFILKQYQKPDKS